MAEMGLACSDSREDLDYFGYALQVEYIDDTASFIGVSSSDEHSALLCGVDPFATAWDTLFEVVAQHDGGGQSMHRLSNGPALRAFGTEQLLRHSIVAFWNADTDSRRGFWSQVGVGDERYLRAVDELG